MSEVNDLYKEWTKRAEDDEKSIQAILSEEGAPSTACFLSQQMTEKILKAALVYFGQSVPKIHDLLALETLLNTSDVKTEEIHDNLIILNRYYIETRYPGDFPEFDWEDAKEAFEAATRVKECISQLLNE